MRISRPHFGLVTFRKARSWVGSCSGSGAFFTQLMIGVSELEVLLHEAERKMMEGESDAFAMSQ